MPSISYNEDNCVTARLAAYITNMKIKITQVLAMVSTTQFVVFQLMNDSTISVIINAPETQPFLHCRKRKACTLRNPVPTTKFIKKEAANYTDRAYSNFIFRSSSAQVCEPSNKKLKFSCLGGCLSHDIICHCLYSSQ